MSVDLRKLPPPAIIITPDYEATYEDLKARLLAARPELVITEATPEAAILQLAAYLVVTKCAEFNDRARGALLAHAVGSDLDHLAALLGVARLLVRPADPAAYPPVAAVWEDDESLRRRAGMALEGITTAGSSGAYIFHALSASAKVADASVDSPAPGEVVVTVLSAEGDGTADAALLATVAAALNAEDVRPLTDRVAVRAAEIVFYDVEATLAIRPGPDRAVVENAARAELASSIAESHRLGVGVARSAIFAALHRPGVARVILTSPAADVVLTNRQAARCAAVTLTVTEAADA